jgi:D-alanyl-D-alanine carboxypeptidase
MTRWACAVAFFLAFASPAAAQRRPTVPPFTPTISGWIDRLGEYEIRAGRTAGLAIGVIEDGRLVYSRGFGYANIAQHVSFDPDTECSIGALSMQFTAAAVLMLVQDGKLKLDDKVVKYVPELTVAGDVTVGELLSQTSGLPDYTKAPDVSSDQTRPVKISDLLAAVNKMQPSAPAGSTYANNDLNYILAGLIVERVGGVPLSDYLQQHIFSPLVMDHTFVAGDSGISSAHAIGYGFDAKANRFVPVRSLDRTWLFGGRGVVSSIYDLAKWDIEMPILLRVDAVRTMFNPSATVGPTQYGMGWVIDRRGGKPYVWYNSDLNGYRAMNALLPDDHVAVIVLSNADGSHDNTVLMPEVVATRILDLVAPPSRARLDNAIVARAREWLDRLADHQIDRTQLTPAFSAYLTDKLIAREDFAALGKLQAIVPISSTNSRNDTVYEFLVRFPHEVQYHYRFGVTKNNKIDEIELVD